jgi:hypothetical protein
MEAVGRSGMFDGNKRYCPDTCNAIKKKPNAAAKRQNANE